MELSRKERMIIKSQINDYMAKLDEITLPRKERMSYKAQINELLAKLDAAIDLAPEAANQNQKLADLIAGKFNAEPPEGFLKILKEIIEEINDIEPVKPPVINYIDANQDKVNAIMESALSEVFGKLWARTNSYVN